MAIYLRASKDAYADRVLLAGDAGRIARLSRRLAHATCVNENRGLVGFTGEYEGVRVSVQTSGMGCPSMAMVVQELVADYGVRRIIRIGTCSAFGPDVRNGDYIVVTGSAAGDGTTRALAEGSPYVAVPNFGLTRTLVECAGRRGERIHVGPVVTVDVEPHLSDSGCRRWLEQGLLAVEMESAALFHLALRAQQAGLGLVEAACILTVSDGLEGSLAGSQTYLSDRELEVATDSMHDMALDAIVS